MADGCVYIINEMGFRRWKIDVEGFRTFPLVTVAFVLSEYLLVNMAVDSSSKYQLRVYRHICVAPEGKIK